MIKAYFYKITKEKQTNKHVKLRTFAFIRWQNTVLCWLYGTEQENDIR